MSDTAANRGPNPFADSSGLDRALNWLKGRERAVLLVGVGLQIAVLLGLIIHHAMPLMYGDTILLRVVPVDPRDLLRGDYVILSYDFSRVPPEGIQGLRQARYSGNRSQWQGRTVYVSLMPEPDGKHWRAGSSAFTVPPAASSSAAG